MNIQPRFTIEDDDFDLLWRFTAYIKQTVYYARQEYLRKLDYQMQESPFDQIPEKLTSYDEPLPTNKDEFDLEEDKLSLVFSKLNLLRRRILTLMFVDGLSPQETADKLHCSVDYVYLQKHRALKALRDQLMEGGGEIGK